MTKQDKSSLRNVNRFINYDFNVVCAFEVWFVKPYANPRARVHLAWFGVGIVLILCKVTTVRCQFTQVKVFNNTLMNKQLLATLSSSLMVSFEVVSTKPRREIGVA